MKTAFKWPLALFFGLHAVLGESAELLGGISDETAPPVAQPEPVDNDRRIIYRVICSPEGEQLPECTQPPVNDTFKAEPENAETPVSPEIANPPLEQTDQEQQPAAVAEPTRKNSAKHKKRSKKSVKKPSKKAAKPAKKRKRHQS